MTSIHCKNEFGPSRSFPVTFELLQQWHDNADKVTPLTAYLNASLRILDELRKLRAATQDDCWEQFHETNMSLLLGVKASSEVLQKRVQGVIELVCFVSFSRMVMTPKSSLTDGFQTACK